MFKLPPINKLAVYEDMYNGNKKTQNLKFNHVLSNPIFMLFNEGWISRQQGKVNGKGKSISNSYNNNTFNLILSKEMLKIYC